MKLPLQLLTSFVVGSVILTAGPAIGQVLPEDVTRVEQAAPAKARVVPRQPRKLLVFNLSLGFKHSAIPYAAKALEVLGRKTGAFTVVQSDDMNIFRRERLKEFDAVCFNNTTQLTFDDLDLRLSLLDFIAGGKGIVGIHAATDNFPTWPEAMELFGGSFDGHPWVADGNWAVAIEDSSHPLTTPFHGRGFVIHDEIYRIKQINLRQNSRVLLGLDMKNHHVRMAKGVRPDDRDIPISWIRKYGMGRLFYCSLGHNPEVYWNRAVLEHYLDGIQFALGDLTADTTPIPFDPMTFFDRDSLNILLQRIKTYAYGDSRASIAELNEFIRGVGDLPEALRVLEKEILRVLQSDATLAAKQVLCTRFAQYASDESVPVLTAMLADSATTGMALYVLEKIPGSTADETLLKTLAEARGRELLGAVTAVGNRRLERSTGILIHLLSDQDEKVAAASASALGHICTPASLAGLIEARNKRNDVARVSIVNAMLACADKFAEEGNLELALGTYKQLTDPGEPMQIRDAALRGLILADEDHAAEVIGATFERSEPELQMTIVALVREVQKPATMHAIARMFPELPPAGQVQLLAGLAHHRDPVAMDVAVKALHSKHADVRTAALRALGSIGDSSTVRVLAQSAADARGREQGEARTSLYRLNAPGVDEHLVSLLGTSNASTCIELVRGIGERRIEFAVPILVGMAGKVAPPIRRECVKVLKNLAGGDRLPEMVSLLVAERVDDIRPDLELATATVASRIADPGKRDIPILDTLRSVKNKKVRLSLLNVLGRLDTPGSLMVLRGALDDADPTTRLAAIRALSQWPTAEPYADLWKVAGSSKERIERTLALRGSTRVLGFDTGRSVDQIYTLYKQGMGAVSNREERRLLISIIGDARSLAAFRLASDYLSDKDLRQEAQVIVANIGLEIATPAKREMTPALQQVLRESGTDSVVQHARQALNIIEKLDDYITLWEYAGPFMKEDVRLFEERFPPEENAGASVLWKLFPARTNPDSAWRLEFDKVMGGNDRVVYVRTNVWCPEEAMTRIELGSDDGVKLWVNGILVHSRDTEREVVPGDDLVEITLRKGWSSLMLKVSQGKGTWGACARVRAVDGGKLEGLRVSTEQR